MTTQHPQPQLPQQFSALQEYIDNFATLLEYDFVTEKRLSIRLRVYQLCIKEIQKYLPITWKFDFDTLEIKTDLSMPPLAKKIVVEFDLIDITYGSDKDTDYVMEAAEMAALV